MTATDPTIGSWLRDRSHEDICDRLRSMMNFAAESLRDESGFWYASRLDSLRQMLLGEINRLMPRTEEEEEEMAIELAQRQFSSLNRFESAARAAAEEVRRSERK